MSARPGSKWLLASTLVAGALVVVLAIQNRALRRGHTELADRANKPYPGMFVPNVSAVSIYGMPVNLGQPTTRFQVLYFFSPTCEFCAASSALVNKLAKALPADVELVGVGNGEDNAIAAYAATQQFAFPVVANRDQRTHVLFRAAQVPLVMAIDRNGRVHHASLGAFDQDEELEAVLAVTRDSSSTTNQLGAAR